MKCKIHLLGLLWLLPFGLAAAPLNYFVLGSFKSQEQSERLAMQLATDLNVVVNQQRAVVDGSERFRLVVASPMYDEDVAARVKLLGIEPWRMTINEGTASSLRVFGTSDSVSPVVVSRRTVGASSDQIDSRSQFKATPGAKSQTSFEMELKNNLGGQNEVSTESNQLLVQRGSAQGAADAERVPSSVPASTPVRLLVGVFSNIDEALSLERHLARQGLFVLGKAELNDGAIVHQVWVEKDDEAKMTQQLSALSLEVLSRELVVAEPSALGDAEPTSAPTVLRSLTDRNGAPRAELSATKSQRLPDNVSPPSHYPKDYNLARLPPKKTD